MQVGVDMSLEVTVPAYLSVLCCHTCRCGAHATRYCGNDRTCSFPSCF